MIIRLLKKIVSVETGQALPVVLCMLVFGGLLIVPSVNFISTSVNSVRVGENKTKAVYAAEAGVEYAIWCIQNSQTPPAELPENINGFQVSIETQSSGSYTVYLGQLVQGAAHGNYLSVTSDIVWDESASAYKYTITVNWQPEQGSPKISIEEVGARLPLGYSYQVNSASRFADNLSLLEPNHQVDSQGANMVNWVFTSPYPYVSESQPQKTQKFYFTGTGDLEGYYTWVVARRGDIGLVGEVSGELYRITATAMRPGTGTVVSRIVADVMYTGSAMEIIYWQITD